jgi:protein-tyrosine-phosphatase
MAEGFLRQRLDARGIDARVHSAGFMGRRQRASAPGVEVMHDYRIDLRGHRSRQLDTKMIDHADLIVGLARRHVFEVARERPEAFGRAFTLKEFVRRAEAIVRDPDESFDAWLARLHAGRKPEHLWGESPDDDVADPIGEATEFYRRTAREIDALVARLVDAVWGGEDAAGTTRRETA